MARGNDICLVVKCAEKNLNDVISDLHGKTMSPVDLLDLSRQLLNALVGLQMRRIAHSRLTPHNVLRHVS